MMEFTFEATPWEQALDALQPGDRIEALKLLSLLEDNDEDGALEALEREVPQEGAIAALRSMDAKVKAILQEVFGPENDIEAIFAGVNLLALGDNGQRLLTNFAAALEPILTQGARACAQAENKA